MQKGNLNPGSSVFSEQATPLLPEAAVGFSLDSELKPADAELFRAFQSNLLSLLSHELKTPLTGILNSLSLLSDFDPNTASDDPGMSHKELLEMAFRNAQRLNHSLSSLLDLAALESGTFHVKLREVDLPRLVRGVAMVQDQIARARGVHVSFKSILDSRVPILADPQKFGRALTLSIELALARAQEGSTVQVEASRSSVQVIFDLKAGGLKDWKTAWSQADVGNQGRATQVLTAFSGTLQDETSFLTRKEEGLGSELLLIHEIMRLHRGVLTESNQDNQVHLKLNLPDLDSLESLRTVLSARSEQISSGIGSVALGLMSVPLHEKVEEFRHEVKSKLFRTTDAVYPLISESQVALVMDDCSPEDALRLIGRIRDSLGRIVKYGVAVYPQEAGDSEMLIRVAAERLRSFNEAGR